MEKDILKAWDNRTEITFISDPGMTPHRGTEHRTTTIISQYKDGLLALEKKEEVVSNFSFSSIYPSLNELLSSRYPIIPVDVESRD